MPPPQIFVRLNPFINLFDPALHTPAYVRARCPLLFSTLLMVGCKFWKPERFRACQRIAEDLCVRAFRECWKRVEVVQAFMCMTYWKEPDDTVCPSTWSCDPCSRVAAADLDVYWLCTALVHVLPAC